MAQSFSRRELFQGIGVGALGLGLLQLPNIAQAQISPASTGLGTVYNFTLGDWEMSIIKDAGFSLAATIFGANQSEADVLELFRSAHVLKEDNSLSALADILVAQSGGETIVFDTGFGDSGAGGTLVNTLAALGIAADDVTTVVSSHWHPDHISGLSSEGKLTFPNAQVLFSQPEYDFLQEAPADVVGNATTRLQPALDGGQVTFYNDEEEIIGGVMAMAAPGHTPGHMAFLLENNGSRLLNLVDATLNVYAHVPNPTWHSQFDAAPDVAVETRIRLMGMAADEGIPVFGYHFPFPGVGYLNRDGDGFQFIPAAF